MGEKLITIATFSQAIEAHLCKTKLEAEGIACFIADEHIVSMNWLYSNAVGGVKLQVKEENAEKALAILRQESASRDSINGAQQTELSLQRTGTPPARDKKDENRRFRCPRCNSPDVFYERFSRRLVFLSWLLSGIPFPFFKRSWKCEKCGYQGKINEVKE